MNPRVIILAAGLLAAGMEILGLGLATLGLCQRYEVVPISYAVVKVDRLTGRVWVETGSGATFKELL